MDLGLQVKDASIQNMFNSVIPKQHIITKVTDK